MTNDASCDAALERRLRAYFHDEIGAVAAPEAVWQRVACRLDLAERLSPVGYEAPAPSLGARAHAAPMARSAALWPQRPKRPPSARWQGFAAVAAALLLIVLGATIFGALAGGRPSGTRGGDQLRPTPQRNAQTPLPAGAMSFVGVSMVSATQGWAIGDVEAAAGEHTGFIERYGDGQWSLTEPMYPSTQLLGVSMQSDGTGWIVGQSEKLADDPQPTKQPQQPPKLIITGTFLLHFAQGAWTRQSAPAGVEVSSVHMISAVFGWALAWSADASAATTATTAADGKNTNNQVLVRYMGGAWQTSTTPTMLTALWLSSPDEGWATDGVRFWHYHAGQWTAGTEAAGLVSDLALTSATDGWATGYVPQGEPSPTTKEVPARPFLLHFDGTTWAPVPLPASLLPHDSWAQRLFLASAAEGWAAGGPNGTAPPALLHYLDSTWSAVPLPAGIALSSISNGAANDAWATGVHYQGDGVVDQAVLLHYANGTWTRAQG
jgi:hypothetical protein